VKFGPLLSELEADRGPRRGSRAGVVVATGPILNFVGNTRVMTTSDQIFTPYEVEC